MEKRRRRLAFATLLSATIFAITWYWYEKTGTTDENIIDSKPIAFVGRSIDDIQRRATTRLLWQQVGQGDPIYNGEAIRTGPKSEVRLEFPDTSSFLDLEPESLVVLKRGSGEISLDLLEGNIYVASEESPNPKSAPEFVLNSPQGKVHLSKAKATLSAAKGGNVEVLIHEGKASLKNKLGQSQEIKPKTEIKIISPSPQKPIALNGGKPEPILFQWDGFPANTSVSLWVGPSRKKLQEFARAKIGEKSLLAQLSLGRHYWKLIGTPSNGSSPTESAIYKSELTARFPPTILFPEPDSELKSLQTPAEIKFRWASQSSIKKTLLTVARDPELKAPFLSKSIEGKDSFLLSGLSEGTYFWKMTSYYEDSDKPIEGPIYKFVVLPKSTDSNQRFPIEPTKIHFNLSEKQLTQTYTDEPYFELSWIADNANSIKKWRVHIYEENRGLENAEVVDLVDKNLKKKLGGPGRYIASIEGLDSKGRMLSSAQTPPIEVKLTPLLEGPQWINEKLKSKLFQTDKVQFEWSPINGAKKYILEITSQNGNTKKINVTSNSFTLNKLDPGTYEAQVYAIDAFNRPGLRGSVRKLTVNLKPEIRAPALKKIKVN